MTDRAVLITGTSTGIGEACAARLAAGGWRVYAGVRRVEDGERLADRHDGDIVPLIVDVTDEATIDAAVARVRADRGSLDGLVNNAGIGVGAPVELLELHEWREQFEVNLFGLVAMTKAAFPLIDAANGRFVHIGSIAGRVGGPGLSPYAASKHAVAGFNWALRAELAGIGRMSSSVVEPGEIKTAIWGKGERRIEEVEERVASAGRSDRYQWLLDLTVGFVAEAQRRGADPDRVAAAVEHALTSDRPKARYLVGTDARAQAALAHLPDRLRELAISRLTAPLMKQGRRLRA